MPEVRVSMLQPFVNQQRKSIADEQAGRDPPGAGRALRQLPQRFKRCELLPEPFYDGRHLVEQGQLAYAGYRIA